MDRHQKGLLSVENASVTEKVPNADVGSGNEMEDRISNLPTDILCHILSFLHTEHAVATSILSTKLRNLFPLTSNVRLCLDDKLHLRPESASRVSLVNFRNFANRLFNVTLRDVPSIYSLCLVCRYYCEGRYISRWVSAALNRNVKRMDIQIHHHIKNARFLIDSLYGCKITSLHLSIDFIYENLEGRFSLPDLKKLYVKDMDFEEVKAILDGCPSIEHLVMYNCSGCARRKFRMYIPSLKVLEVLTDICPKLEIEVDCPKLEILEFSGKLGNHHLKKKLMFLRIARFDLYGSFNLNSFETNHHVDVEQLYLSEEIMTALHRWSGPLPRFQNLVSLTMKNVDSDAWELLPSLFECSPSLKNLIFERGFNMRCIEKLRASSLKESWPVWLSQRDERCFIVDIERGEDNNISS